MTGAVDERADRDVDLRTRGEASLHAESLSLACSGGPRKR
jgi:hypothetical protein